MKKAQRKDFFVEIKRSLNRYLSILAIVALGVAFFVGIRSSEPDMRLSADAVADESNFMDIRVLSTMGLTEEDLESIRQVPGITEAEGEYSVDVLSIQGDTSLSLHVVSMTRETNRLTVTEGRLPEQEGECLIDSQLLISGDYEIGDEIVLESGTDDPLSDSLSRETYTIVGAGSSPYYLNFDRGTTTIGNGTLDGFLVVLPEEFQMDVYTQIYAAADSLDGYVTGSEEYQEAADGIREAVEDIAGERCQVRLDGIQADAMEEIEDGQRELDDKRAEAEEQLSSAWQEITDGEAELAAGREEIEENEKLLEDSRIQIQENEKKLEDGKAEIASGEEELEQTRQLLIQTRDQVESGQEAYDQANAQYQEQSAQVTAARQALEEGRTQIQENEKKLEAMRQALEAAGVDPDTVPEYTEGMSALQAAREELAARETQVEAAEAALASGKEQLDQAAAELETGRAAISQLEAGIEAGEAELAAGRQEIADGEAQLEAARQQLADGEAQLEEARQEIADGEAEIQDAKTEYEEAKTEAETELADAQAELDDAREEVEELELPEWYVLDRTSVQSYVEFDSDADNIGAIGNVFPVIFFLVAALVSLTTMTRMVEEKRTEIGTMKALGYGTMSIAAKYIGYALSATLIGSVLGFLIGGKFIPWVIITAYKILYVNLTVVEIPYNWGYGLMAAGIFALCTAGAAFAACYKATLSQPAQLMRPVAPLKGKKIFLERVRPLWKRLSFSQKSTLRNLFRYKKRLLMTVFGIGACMALLLVGYGIRDSIYVVSDRQYGELWLYDAMLSVDEDADKEELYSALEEDENIQKTLTAYAASMDGEGGGVTKEINLLVPEDLETFEEMFVLRDRESGEIYTLDDQGAVVSEKLAGQLGISAGDEIVLRKDETSQVSVPVAHVAENYVYHYVYMSPALYEQVFGEAPSYNSEYLALKDAGEEAAKEMSQRVLEISGVSGVTLVSDMNQTITDMLGSLDLVVWVLIVSAGLLAFVVLYNLNNINITERKRELATIKLLGFYDMELAVYVYRENVLLTLIGIAAGIFMGNVLHRFIINTVEVDMIMFGRTIHFISYLYGIGLTLLFAVFVNVTMFYKLRRIDMVESLKSVE